MMQNPFGLDLTLYDVLVKRWTVLNNSFSFQQGSGDGKTAQKNLISIRISTQHAVNYGEVIRIVGAGSALGDWNPEQGPGCYPSPNLKRCIPTDAIVDAWWLLHRSYAHIDKDHARLHME